MGEYVWSFITGALRLPRCDFSAFERHFFSVIARLHHASCLRCYDYSNTWGGVKVQFGMHKNATSQFIVLLQFCGLLTQELWSILFCINSHFRNMKDYGL